MGDSGSWTAGKGAAMEQPAAERAQKRGLDLLVGLAVRNERSIAGMTLSELSAKSGVSSPMISKIERGHVSASLSTLNALAGAIGVPIINFFAETVEIGEVAFVRAGEGVTVRRAGSTYGHVYRQLGRVSTGHLDFETYLITLDRPVAGTPFFQHSGVELLHLLEGSLSYRIGEESYELGPGDTLTFESEAPHGPVRMTSARAVFLTVIARPK
ncbi:helix-turn-helix domain-containing protein [Acidimangrovimonas pyrenivorans]|uniref:Helix-turn-helix domain-containing protein n=1 Tax=Acidimangrovimonas pyrenivorans TaxID=2030798 RepID=A0ABV7AE26_9RHOB